MDAVDLLELLSRKIVMAKLSINRIEQTGHG